jgi:hypothetical protein
MNNHRMPQGTLPAFDTLPTLSDENIADVLNWLIVFVDAFEEHYADPLARWRQKRYEELHELHDDEQLQLPIADDIDDPF